MDRDLSNRTLGQFILCDKLGEGGQSDVYRGTQPQLKREVAIKVMRQRCGDDREAKERFVREARLASLLDHPYAAHVYDFGILEEGWPWIAMELIEGITLRAWLAKHGPMPFERFVAFFERLAKVVHAAHRLGIVHRDLKPSNIMVIEDENDLYPKLIDFGIAKQVCPIGIRQSSEGSVAENLGLEGPQAADAVSTPVGVAIGSLSYMSPEQSSGAVVTTSADIYSLGVIAFESLTGRLPVAIFNEDEFCSGRWHEVPASLGGDFSHALSRILQCAMAKRPEARYQTPRELAAELRAVLDDNALLRLQAQRWKDEEHRPDLLLSGKSIERLESLASALGTLECSYVAASQSRARRVRWATRAFAVLVAVVAAGALVWISEMHAHVAETEARDARKLTEAKIGESELEQGRAALLHGEPDALPHLAKALRLDPQPTTAFMLARAAQSRLAEKARLVSTQGRMWWAAFSPDGSRIVTADDRAAQIWDATSYRLLLTLPHGCEVYQAIFSADGTRLVTIARTMVRIWDVRSGALLHDLKAGRGQTPANFYRGAVSSDGKFVAAMHAGGTVVSVWDIELGTPVARLRNQGGDFPNLVFGADGWLATTAGEEARVFETKRWTQVGAIRGAVRRLAFGARGLMMTGAPTGEVALWSIPNMTKLRQLRKFGEAIEALAFSPDGTLAAAGDSDGAVQVWQTSSGALQSQLNPRHGKIVGVELNPDAARLLAATSDGTVVIADVSQGLPLAVLDGPSNALRVASFSPDGARVVGVSRDDGTATVWESSSPYRRWATAPNGEACDIGLGSRADGRFIAVGCRGLPTRVWDTARDRLLAELPSATPSEVHDFMYAAPVVSSAGDLAAVPRGETVELYDLPGGRPRRTIAHGASVTAIAFSDSGHAVASGALDGSVRVIREDGTERALQASGGVEALVLLPDGRVIVADAERRLRVYAADGTVTASLELPARVMSLRREGARLVALPNCLATAAPPFLIDLERYRVDAKLEGHVGCVLSARWSLGQRVLTAGADGTARLWDGSTGRLLQTFKGSPRFLGDAVLMSGMVITGDANGMLGFWDAASGAKLWTLPTHRSAVIGVHLEGPDIVTRGFTGEISRWRLPQSGAVIDACASSRSCAIVR